MRNPRRLRSAPDAPSPRLLAARLRAAGLQIAPRSRRLLAWLLDVGLFVVPAVALVDLTGGLALLVRTARSVLGRELGILGNAAALPGSDLVGARTPLVQVLALVGVVVGFGLAWVVVRIVATAWTGRTPGKWLLGLRVVDEANPTTPPRLAKAALRWLVPQVSSAVPLPGTGAVVYAPVLKDPWRRGLHDRAAGTVVVRAGGSG
jgi:uncharacterized RDD family membrane protein YckC